MMHSRAQTCHIVMHGTTILASNQSHDVR